MSSEEQIEKDKFYMGHALMLAEEAFKKGEVPVGAVIVCRDKIIARAYNLTEALIDVTAHAEMQAITMSANELGGKYLQDCTLYVTVEPCVMCSGAIGLARIPHVIYGAKNTKFGAAGSLYDILSDSRLNHRVEVETGILEDQCAKIMQDFFRKGRQRKKEAKLSEKTKI